MRTVIITFDNGSTSRVPGFSAPGAYLDTLPSATRSK